MWRYAYAVATRSRTNLLRRLDAAFFQGEALIRYMILKNFVLFFPPCYFLECSGQRTKNLQKRTVS